MHIVVVNGKGLPTHNLNRKTKGQKIVVENIKRFMKMKNHLFLNALFQR